MNDNAFNLIEMLNKSRIDVNEIAKTERLGRVDFLNHKDQIRKAFENGYSVKKIWSELSRHKQIKIGYKMFLIYFREYIRDEVERPTGKKGTIQRGSIRKTQRTESTKSANKTENTIDKQTGFVYDGRPKKGLI